MHNAFILNLMEMFPEEMRIVCLRSNNLHCAQEIREIEYIYIYINLEAVKTVVAKATGRRTAAWSPTPVYSNWKKIKPRAPEEEDVDFWWLDVIVGRMRRVLWSIAVPHFSRNAEQAALGESGGLHGDRLFDRESIADKVPVRKSPAAGVRGFQLSTDGERKLVGPGWASESDAKLLVQLPLDHPQSITSIH